MLKVLRVTSWKYCKRSSKMSDVELQAKKVSLDVWQDVKKRSV